MNAAAKGSDITEMQLDLPALRQFAELLCSEAGDALRQATAPAAIVEKAPGDWASALDAAIEEQLRSRIQSRYPAHQFWGEESNQGPADGRETGPSKQGADDAASAHQPPLTWVVDPIDGSINFLRGYPQYAVSIALLADMQPIVGAILDPVRGELFSAARGLGAHCNGRPLQVAPTTDLGKAIAATVFPKPKASFMDDYLRQLTRVMRGTAGVRRAGSMALELAYLAAGRVDCFWEYGMGAWDAAAGLLLIEEAGGAVWPLDDQPWWRTGGLAASAPGVRTAWTAMLQGANVG